MHICILYPYYSSLLLVEDTMYLTSSQSARQWPQWSWPTLPISSLNWWVCQGSQLAIWDPLERGKYQGMQLISVAAFARRHSSRQLLKEQFSNNSSASSFGNRHFRLSGVIVLTSKLELQETIHIRFIKNLNNIHQPNKSWGNQKTVLVTRWKFHFTIGCVSWSSNENLERSKIDHFPTLMYVGNMQAQLFTWMLSKQIQQ